MITIPHRSFLNRLSSSVIRRRRSFDPFACIIFTILVCGSSVECMGETDFGLSVGKCVFGWFGASYEANRFLRAVSFVLFYYLVHRWWSREKRRSVRWSPSPFAFRCVSLTDVITRISQSPLNGNWVPLRIIVMSGGFLSHFVGKSTVGVCSYGGSRNWEFEGLDHIASPSLLWCYETNSVKSVFYGDDLFCRI